MFKNREITHTQKLYIIYFPMQLQRKAKKEYQQVRYQIKIFLKKTNKNTKENY